MDILAYFTGLPLVQSAEKEKYMLRHINVEPAPGKNVPTSPLRLRLRRKVAHL